MRRSWDEPADEVLDEPVALTARQLRSLNRGARFGFFALVLAIIAAGTAGWTAFRAAKAGPGTSTSVPAAAQPHAAEGGLADASTAMTASGAPTAPAPAVPTSSATPKATQAVKAEVAVATSSKRTHAPAATRTPKPVTESFEPASAAPALTAPPSPVPMPVSAEPAAKPAARDSSAAR